VATIRSISGVLPAEMLEANRESHNAAVQRGEMVGPWDEAAEKALVEERAAIIAAMLAKIVEHVKAGAHIDASVRHIARDKNQETWAVFARPPDP
jgi:hypothetical protein